MASKEYKISKKQSLLDACIQVYGTAKLLFDFAKANNLQIDSVVNIGDTLIYDDSLGVPKVKKAIVRTAKDIANDGIKPPVIYNDWFLPSLDLLLEMYTNLKSFGVGNFNQSAYWSSSENNNAGAKNVSFISGAASSTPKGAALGVRAARSFEAAEGAYNLRDEGPAGGLIFYVNSTTYYEASPLDLNNSVWSNIDNLFIGTTGEVIGTGKQNTQDIINQAGHTDSAAKLCNDLVIEKAL
jgi:hypothetical protein